MSKEGCLKRIELYTQHGNDELLAREQAFFAEHYAEEPKTKKSKKTED